MQYVWINMSHVQLLQILNALEEEEEEPYLLIFTTITAHTVTS